MAKQMMDHSCAWIHNMGTCMGTYRQENQLHGNQSVALCCTTYFLLLVRTTSLRSLWSMLTA
jgi:hypothetical protein